MSNYQRSQNNVNTQGPRFKGDKFALMVDYWNKRLVLGFARKLNQSEMTEDGFNYDWKNPTKVTIAHADVIRLRRACNQVLEGKATSLGVPIVSTGKNYIVKIDAIEGTFAVSLEKEIDPTSRVSKGSVDYKFNKDFLIANYNGETGDSTTVDADTEFEMFILSLSEFVKGATLAKAHTFNEASKYNASKNMAALAKIAGALNVDLGFNSSGYNKGGNSGGGVDWTGAGDMDVPF